MSPAFAVLSLLPTLGLVSPPTWSVLEPGVEHTMVRVATSAGLPSSRMHVFRIDLRTHKLVPIDARRGSSSTTRPASQSGDVPTPSRTRATVSTLAKERPLPLVVNGTYFDEKDRPLGLLVGEQGEINPLRRADWGVFYVTGGRAALVHTTEWRKLKATKREFAIQTGPRCVIDGEPVKLKPQVARRAALGIQTDGRVLIAVSTSELLSADLARFMAKPEAEGGLACRHAVMLDGGGSAQVWARFGDRQWHVPGAWPVPNAVAVMRR